MHVCSGVSNVHCAALEKQSVALCSSAVHSRAVRYPSASPPPQDWNYVAPTSLRSRAFQVQKQIAVLFDVSMKMVLDLWSRL